MKLDNRKMICAVIAFMMVCLLYPFSGKKVCAAERISAEKPCAGQQNTYTYSGSDAVWTVPATGFYKIECYGGGGARGVGGIEGGGQNIVSGGGGDSVAATVLLSSLRRI